MVDIGIERWKGKMVLVTGEEIKAVKGLWTVEIDITIKFWKKYSLKGRWRGSRHLPLRPYQTPTQDQATKRGRCTTF